VLNFGHEEFTDSKETLLGSNLVSERFTDLGRSEWDSTVVEFEKSSKVDKVALGSLGSKVAIVSALIVGRLTP
jgi:hypothetical protein